MAKVPISLTLHPAPRESKATEVKNGGEGDIVTAGIWQEPPSSTRPPRFSLNRRHPLRWVYHLSFCRVTLSTLKAVTCFYLFHCPSPPGLGVLLRILFPPVLFSVNLSSFPGCVKASNAGAGDSTLIGYSFQVKHYAISSSFCFLCPSSSSPSSLRALSRIFTIWQTPSAILSLPVGTILGIYIHTWDAGLQRLAQATARLELTLQS